MTILTEKRNSQHCDIVCTKYYTDWIRYCGQLFRISRTRQVYEVPDLLWNFQCSLGYRVAELEGCVRTAKRQRKAALESGSEEDVHLYDIGIWQNRTIVNVIKAVADGIVWRLTNYDRQLMRVTADPNKTSGSVDLKTAISDSDALARKLIQENGSYVILNDLTRFVRTGDLTEILPDGRIVFHELKENGKIVKNLAFEEARVSMSHGKVSRQVQQMINAQFAANSRVIKTAKGLVKVKAVGVRFSTFIDTVSRVITRTKRDHFSASQLSDYTFVHCTDLTAAVADSLATGRRKWLDDRSAPNWPGEDLVIWISSLDSLYDDNGSFSRNHTPYSVFPFSTNVCVRLMAGQLILRSAVNITRVMRIFENHGFVVIPVPPDVTASLMNEHAEGRTGDTLSYSNAGTAFRIKRGAFNMDIPYALILRLASDFVDINVIIASAEKAYNDGPTTEPEVSVYDFPGESSTWH